MSDPNTLPTDLPPDLLAYGISTLPSPLQVSTPSASSPGAVNLWAAPPQGTTVFCRQIKIGVPIGDGETDLTEKTPTVTPNTSWWAVSAMEIERGEALGLAVGTTYAVFTATCVSDAHWEITYDLQFSVISAAVNQTQGAAGFVLAEVSGATAETMVQRRSVYGVPKGPSSLYLNNLMTTAPPPGALGVPLTAFPSGAPIRLVWASNAATFAVHVGSDPTPVWTGSSTSTVLDAGLTDDATLTVVATNGDGATQVAATSVAIINPTLTPTAATAGTLAAGGATTLTGAATIATLAAAGLAAHAAASLPGGAHASTLNVGGGATLKAGGTATSLTVNGTLTAARSALGAASASAVSVADNVGMFNPHSIGAGNYVAASDGLAVANVGWPSDPKARCETVAYGSTAGVGTIYARGGNGQTWTNGKDWWMCNMGNSLVLPVRRGSGFSVGAVQVQGNDVNAPVAYAWIPFGSSASLTALSDAEALAYGLPVPFAELPLELDRPPFEQEVDGLLGAASAIFGDRFTPDLRKRLQAAVTTLASRRR